jgi:hypothetical protein
VTDQSAVFTIPPVSLLVNDEIGSVRFDANDFGDLFAKIARRNEQLAAWAASRNAITTASPAASPTADSTSGSEGRPARKRKPAAETGEEHGGGKGGSGDAKAAAEETDTTVVEPEGATEPAAAEDASAVTYDDVRNAVVGLAAAKGRDAAIAVLDQFGVDHASKLTEAQWPEALAALTDAQGAA